MGSVKPIKTQELSSIGTYTSIETPTTTTTTTTCWTRWLFDDSLFSRVLPKIMIFIWLTVVLEQRSFKDYL